ncbi:MAG: nitroreductase [Alphaproteobacteria bacterium]|nr:nitroreductase [Alphaproteobacteria bacterium]
MVIAAKQSPELLDYLLQRRTVEAVNLGEPGPTPDDIERILTAAARVPDHGRMFPWYFLVIEGEARAQIGGVLRKAYPEEDPAAAEAKIDLESEKFLRAPLVIGVISRIRKGRHPMFEQILSAGAACQNLVLAANALGFATHWLSEWYAYNETVREALGLDERDNVAGFISIGTPKKEPVERPRPELSKIVTRWEPGVPPNKGDEYDKEDMGFPVKGFSLP